MKDRSAGLGRREAIQADQVDVPLQPRAEQADQPLWILGCPGEWPYHVHLLSAAIHLLSFYEGSDDRSGPIPSVEI